MEDIFSKICRSFHCSPHVCRWAQSIHILNEFKNWMKSLILEFLFIKMNSEKDEFRLQKCPSMGDMKPLRLRRLSMVSTRTAGLGDLGVPLTRHLSIEPPANLAYALGQHMPSWAFYHYNSPDHRSMRPWRLFRDRFDCERIMYDKHFSVQPIYRNVPTGVPSHRSNFSNHQKAGYWSFDYDYMHELPPKRLFSVFDPFDDDYKHWYKYGSRRMDEMFNRRCLL